MKRNYDTRQVNVFKRLSVLFQIGFSDYTQTFSDYQVDGDLLLTLTNASLRDDLKMDNGITRKRCNFFAALNGCSSCLQLVGAANLCNKQVYFFRNLLSMADVLFQIHFFLGCF